MKKVGIALIVLAVLLCLLPIPRSLKDGGSKTYAPLLPLYQVWDYHTITATEDGTEGIRRGVEITVFGITVYENTEVVPRT